jgi:hypothetical protein
MKNITFRPNDCDSVLINGLKIKIVSYCYENVMNTEVPIYQKKVFDKFEMLINQFSSNLSHCDFMDYIVKYEDCDAYIFFDIDCIPLKPNLYQYIIDTIVSKNCILGIEQCSGIATSSPTLLYAGPACFAITSQLYNYLGRPSFKNNERSDVAQELTHLCNTIGIDIQFFKHTSSKNYKWNLGIGKKFGNASIYDDWLYHQFEIKRDNDNNQNIMEFIEKCKSILSTNY